jgi:hypothetical protein
LFGVMMMLHRLFIFDSLFIIHYSLYKVYLFSVLIHLRPVE